MLQNPFIKVEQADIMTEIHIADIHFGNRSTKIEEHYAIMVEQFLNPISTIRFDLLSINGDYFDHKFMAGSDVIMYATMFFDLCVQLCRQRGATLVIMLGTKEHDADQLKLFYHYLNLPGVDVRIIEQAKFEWIKGHRFLYMPEEYSMGAEYYDNLLNNSGFWDTTCLHGTFVGTSYGADKVDMEAIRPVFSVDQFGYCGGPIICGHIHKPQCTGGGYVYYSGCPIRYKFGEEEPKGYLIVLHNYTTREFYCHFNEIESFRYDTINLDHMLNSDPKVVIDYIKNLKANGIDKVRVQFSVDSPNIELIKNYFASIPYVKIDTEAIKKQQATINANQDIFEDEYAGLDFILDDTLDKREILCRYANIQKGYTYITVDELISLLEDK